jgi:crotonobetainyl-CoA:carnitine CoA-transferase CaiB-like acyl-CoA transferase
MSSALDGIRIVDLTNVGPGAHCTRILADLGADVIRIVEARSVIEKRGRRQWKAPIWAYGMRRNTRPLGLDLKREEGLEVFFKLLEKADVVMVGLRPSAAERLGVHYDAVHEANPRVVYCSLTGFGADGPYRDIAGHDINYQAMGGIVGLTGLADGPPMIPGATAADSAGGGMHAAIAILAAVIAQRATGKGQFVDVAATDGIVNMVSLGIDEYLTTGEEPKRGEALLTGRYPWYNIYETSDGKYVSVGAIEAQFYANLCRLMGLEDLIPHQYAEGEKKEEIFRRLREVFRTRTRDEWVSLLMEEDTCTGPVYSISEMVSDPNLLHRKMVIEVDHPTEGRMKQAGIMVKLSLTPGEIKHVDPQPADFTEEILAGADYGQERIDALRKAGVVD